MNQNTSVMLQDIQLIFDDNTKIFENLNLNISHGETISILGRGGSGKTTLCKLIVGLIQNYKGFFYLFGEDKKKIIQRNQKQSKIISMSFQQGALFDFMTIGENIEFALENCTTVPRRSYKGLIESYLEKVELKDIYDKFPSELSGGMRRRVGIVRSLIIQPDIVLFDEPTAGLDPITSAIVIDLIHNISENYKSTMICVTSIVEIAFKFSKKVAILESGKIIGSGTEEELLALKDPFIDKFLNLRKISHESVPLNL